MPAEATVGRMARLAKEAGAEGSPEGAKTPVRERREGMADRSAVTNAATGMRGLSEEVRRGAAKTPSSAASAVFAPGGQAD